ncbi:response regulator [Paenibacillus sp. GD4]|jgi:two-component system, response regulator YesN|uniref:response regulator transcription factor n=1 Tax=Paenibacillus sp. GD4 TaxID=3068890 RepID=UPI002796C4B0|nr:response regulator [Paenibacillus sp. GD4]MDQ1908996.1 response regulator [Paenibacillus sp. GD4]
MYSLLIVDDEPRIVNGLYEQFLDWRQEELSVYRAYTSVEALRILNAIKIDILLSDIQMPGMNGIELQKKIHEVWPRCKVIFLSGYSDFEYVQSAMRDGGLDYILKVEGDEPIFAAVGKAIDRLKEERVSEQLLQKAKRQLEASRLMMQKDYLTSLLQGDISGNSVGQDRFDELYIPLLARERVLLALGRVDRWPENMRPTDRSLYMYAITNISSEYFSQGQVTAIAFSITSSHLAWLIQPVGNGNGGVICEEEWEKCYSFVRGTSSDIQETCKVMLKLPVSIAISGTSSDWQSAAVQYLRLEQLFQQGFGHGREMLLSDRTQQETHELAYIPQGLTREHLAVRLKAVKQLELFLHSGQKDEFFELYDEIEETARLLQGSSSLHPFLVEIEYALSSLFLSYLNQRGLLDRISANIDTSPLLQRGAFSSWREAEAYYRKLSEQLFTQRADEQTNRTQQVLTTLNQYIERNLADDLSLEKLADHVYLHPTYLSRLYKQISGVRLSDYIKEVRLKKAAELLANPRLKIHEVAVGVGFESAHYFTKVFKKEMHMTPQEFRDRCQSEKS